jgi:hypothetical protein
MSVAGSKTEVSAGRLDVRFTPKRGHPLLGVRCPLDAESVAKVPECRPINFSQKDRTNARRPSM